jgi:glutamate-1-semialdehyde 2,1-aminomutase
MRQATAGAPVSVNRVGSMLSLFFTESPPTDFASVSAADTDAFRRFFWHLLERGIHLAPSPFEAGFLSTAHAHDDIDRTCEVAGDWFTREYR